MEILAPNSKNFIPRLTTLCYLERDGKHLILHRTKKTHDENDDKWIGVGGKFEYGESPEECAMREVKEETGVTMLNPRFRGIVTFVSDEWGVEYMHLFTCTEFAGELFVLDAHDEHLAHTIGVGRAARSPQDVPRITRGRGSCTVRFTVVFTHRRC